MGLSSSIQFLKDSVNTSSEANNLGIMDSDEENDEPIPPPPAFLNNDNDADNDDDDADIEDGEIEVMVQEAASAQSLPLPLKRSGSSADDDNDDEESVNGQPPPKRASETPQGTVEENFNRIGEAIEQMMGQNMTSIAGVLVRNEPGLSMMVEELRRSLAIDQGRMGTTWENLLVGLGPPQPRPISEESRRPSQEQAGQPGDQFTEVSAKIILRNLGHIFELYAALMRRLGYGNGRVMSTEIFDNNRVAYAIGQVMNQLADMLQYTYRQNLHNITRNIETQCSKAKERVETAITKARELQDILNQVAVVDGGPLPFLQVLPAITFPAIEEAQIRYRISIPRDDLLTNPLQLVQETNKSSNNEGVEQTLTQGEENLLLRFGTLSIINGTRTTAVNFTVHAINFHIYQVYISEGWINPTVADPPPPGQYVRALEFHLNKFKEGSVQHEIKAKSHFDKTSTSAEGQTQQIEISVSGIVEGAYTLGSAVGQRIAFVFVLPPHLSMKHVNDVGVRDSVLRIQFAQ